MIRKAVLDVLGAHGIDAREVRLMPIEPPRAWGVSTNVCMQLGPQVAREEIELKTEGLGKKEAKKVAAQVSREVSEKLAEHLAEELQQHSLPFIATVEAEGAYVNFYYDAQALAAHVVESVLGKAYGALDADARAALLTDADAYGHGVPTGKRIMVEYAQPNTHKDFHVGHLRNASIGQAIANLQEFAGNDVLKATYLGDVGAHVAAMFAGMHNHLVEKYDEIRSMSHHLEQVVFYSNQVELVEVTRNKVDSIEVYFQEYGELLNYWLTLLIKFQPYAITSQRVSLDYQHPSVTHSILAQKLFTDLPDYKPFKQRLQETGSDRTRWYAVQYAASAQFRYRVDGPIGAVLSHAQFGGSIDQLRYSEKLKRILELLWLIRQDYRKAVSEWLSAFESKEHSRHSAVRSEWNDSRNVYLKYFCRIFQELYLSFDDEYWFFESVVDDSKLGQKTAAELKELGIAMIDDSEKYKGALYVDFVVQADALRPDGTPVFRDDEKKRIRKLGKMTILRSDGTSLYQTKELGLAKHKFDLVRERFGTDLDESLYVVGAEQKLYFDQVFAILRLWGFPNAENCKHISYELVVLPGGKMSSREGNIVSYRDLRDEAINRAIEITTAKGIAGDVAETAHDIAIAAIKYAMLQVTGNQQIVFDFEQALSFSGRAAPYLQYAYARAGKLVTGDLIAGGAGVSPADSTNGGQDARPTHQDSQLAHSNPGYELHPSELMLARVLGQFPAVCADAAAHYEPATLCTYLYDMATAFSDFYRDCRVLDADEPMRTFRMRLCAGFRQVMRTGFAILALPLPEEM